jgi:RND family efflux transporter MFP subunit
MQVNTHRQIRPTAATLAVAAVSAALSGGCSSQKAAVTEASGSPAAVSVGVAPVTRRSLVRQLTVSSELVPFQEIDLYAKEAGYIKELLVDYGTRVQTGQLLAVLEIPELQMQLDQDAAAIRNQQDVVQQNQHQIERVEALVKDYQLQFTRLKSVSDKKPGLVAQQEVDDSEGKYMAADAQLEAAKSALQSARSELAGAQAKEQRDRVLFDYSKIYAPFSGVITQRYANYGTLVQAGTSSSTNVLPIAKLSEDDKFRLVIPVPESYVKYIHIGDAVDVHVPSLDRHFPGRVGRFSTDVAQDTRTMHTEVDVLNPNRVLMPGLYADATITLERKDDALSVPLQAINHEANGNTVFVVTPNNTIAIRSIQVGLQNADWAEVKSGLNEGDSVVVSDRASLKDGAAVQPHAVELTQYTPQSQ